MSEKDCAFVKMLQTGVLPEAPACFERLFLLEFMVHEVCYDCAASMDLNFLQTLGPTCVAFNSDSFPPLEMSEDEFGVSPPFESVKVKFKSGKSCLFAFKRGTESLVSDKAQITVSRRLPPGGCSPEYTFGKAYLKMSPEFLSVLSSPCTISKCLKVSLDILNCQMENRGSIAIFLRLSCFGTTIITQFQADSASDSKSFSFRGDIIANVNQGNTATPGMLPQCQTQLQNLAPNISEKAKEELIVDLLKVIKSTTMLNYILNHQSNPRGDQIVTSTGIPPNNAYGNLAYDSNYQTKFRGQFGYPNFFLSPQPSSNIPQLSPNNDNLSFPIPLPRNQNNFGRQNNFAKPYVANAIFPSFKSTNNPDIYNRLLTHEPKEILNTTVSENVLCKPEWRLKENNSQCRAMVANASLSRNSVRRNSPSRSTWYSPGPSEAFMYKRG